MPYKKRTNKRTTKRKPQAKRYRERIAKTIPFANQKPSSVLVRFQGRHKYLVAAPGNVNSKSIIRVPASFMGEPVATAGSWIKDGQLNFVQGYSNFFSKYQHYKVLGSQLRAVVKGYSLEVGASDGQLSNLAFAARVPDVGNYTSATTMEELETNYGITQKQWSAPGAEGYRQASIGVGYSPKKEHNIKDIQDNAHIRMVTEYDSAGPENTYFNVILAGELDAVLKGHPSAVVTIQTNYLISLEEPKIENAPTMMAGSVQ
jgi:hypothetical protein